MAVFETSEQLRFSTALVSLNRFSTAVGKWLEHEGETLCMPAETSSAICNLIFGGVFERFPNLKFCFSHGAGSFPYTLGRIDHGFQVRPDLCATDNNVSPRKYLGKIYADSLVHDENSLQLLVKVLGKDNIMLGSDYPFPLGEEHPGKLIEEAEFLSEESKKNILGRNALSFLNISMEDFVRE